MLQKRLVKFIIWPKFHSQVNSRAGIQTQIHLIQTLKNHTIFEIPHIWNHEWMCLWPQGTDPPIRQVEMTLEPLLLSFVLYRVKTWSDVKKKNHFIFFLNGLPINIHWRRLRATACRKRDSRRSFLPVTCLCPS